MHYLMVDSSFLHIFSFPLLQGNPKTALQSKDNIILSKNMAEKLFGNESPIGKKVLIDAHLPLTVTGVIDDISKILFLFRQMLL